MGRRWNYQPVAPVAVFVLGAWALFMFSEPRRAQELTSAGFGPLAIIFRRTPYEVANSARNFVTSFKTLADEGYTFAFQDIRGKVGSESQFIMQRPSRAASAATVDEATDTYATIEWLLKNMPGRSSRYPSRVTISVVSAPPS